MAMTGGLSITVQIGPKSRGVHTLEIYTGLKEVKIWELLMQSEFEV